MCIKHWSAMQEAAKQRCKDIFDGLKNDGILRTNTE